MKINAGRINDPIRITKMEIDNSGSRPKEVEVVVSDPSYAEVTEMYVKDYQLSMQNGTLGEVKLTLRYDSRIDSKMRIYRYRNKATYKIKHILSDERNFHYMHIYAQRVDVE